MQLVELDSEICRRIKFAISQKEKFVIAVDGTSSSGKGTISRIISSALGLEYLDTGLLYRCLALHLLERNIKIGEMDYIISAARQIQIEDRQDLRHDDVSMMASSLSGISEVRRALDEYQYDFMRRNKYCILDGRDIGCKIAPDAEIKFFVTASPEVRAERRFKQLKSETYESILTNIIKRDKMDSSRGASPMRIADSAIVIDSSNDSVEDSLAKVIDHVSKYIFD